jgi:anaerobic magnesium-protoporphyrin IX monomethyl ester cyclase
MSDIRSSSRPGGLEKTLKAAVVVTPVTDFYTTRHRFSGLGVSVLRQCLAHAGCEVEIFNFLLHGKKPAILQLPDALRHLRPLLVENETGKLSFFTRYQRFGPDIRTCADRILAVSPDLVFISCFAFCYAWETLELAHSIRIQNSQIPVIVGGAGVSAYPEFFIREPSIDFAVVGEAEVAVGPLLAVLRAKEKDFSQIPNLYWKSGRQIMQPSRRVFTKAEEIVFVMRKTRETAKAVYLTTALSRGCPKLCRFCSNFLCHGHQFRTIPADKVLHGLASIELSKEQRKKIIYINFEDDNLLFAPNYFLEIIDIIKARFPGARFLAENGLDYTRLTPEMVDRLAARGMDQFNLSISSIDSSILKQESRMAELPKYLAIVRRLAQLNIPCITYFICGFAGDTPETVVSNIVFLAGLPTRIGISLFYPVPGIPDFEEKRIFDDIEPLLCAGSSAYPWNKSLTTAQMITAFRLCRFANLLKAENRTDADMQMIARIMQERILFTMVRTEDETKIVLVPELDNDMVALFFQKAASMIKSFKKSTF